MQYRVYANDICIHDSASPNKEFKCFQPSLVLEDSQAGSFEFNLTEGNPGYDKVERLNSDIIVKQRSSLSSSWEEIWAGRVLQEDISMEGIRSLYCEGELSFLNDTCQPQREYSMTPNDIMDNILSYHNSRVEDRRKFYWDSDNSPFPNEVIKFATQYNTTMNAITQIMSLYECHVHVEKRTLEENGPLLRYLVFTSDSTFDTNSSQTIRFGKNLLDYTGSYDLSQIATVLVPLGKKINSAGQELIGDECVYHPDTSWDYDDKYNYKCYLFKNKNGYVEWINDTHSEYRIAEIWLRDSETPPSGHEDEYPNNTNNPVVPTAQGKYIYITARGNFGKTMYVFYSSDWTQLAVKEASNSAGVTDLIESRIELPIGTKYIRASGFGTDVPVRINASKEVSESLDEYLTVADVNDGSVYVTSKSINKFRSAMESGSIDYTTGKNVANQNGIRSEEYDEIEAKEYTISASGKSVAVDLLFYDKGDGEHNIGDYRKIEIDKFEIDSNGQKTETESATKRYSTTYVKLNGDANIGALNFLFAERSKTWPVEQPQKVLKAKLYAYTESGGVYTYVPEASGGVFEVSYGINGAASGGNEIELFRDDLYAMFEIYFEDETAIGDDDISSVWRGNGFSHLNEDESTVDSDCIRTRGYTYLPHGDMQIYHPWSTDNLMPGFRIDLYTKNDQNQYVHDDTNTRLLNADGEYPLVGDTLLYIPADRYAMFTWNSDGITLPDIGFIRREYQASYNANRLIQGVTLPYTFTSDANQYIRVVFRASGDTVLTPNDIYNIQLEEGGVMHPYESPYSPLDIYGWYERQVTWDDVESAEVLYNRAVTYLRSGQFDSMTITIKAIDMCFLGVNANAIKVGQKIRVTSIPHGLDRYFDVTSLTIDLDDANNNTFTLGKEQTLTLSSSSNAINSELQSLISGSKRDALLEEARTVSDAEILGASRGRLTTLIGDDGMPFAHFYSKADPDDPDPINPESPSIPITPKYSDWTAADKAIPGLLVNNAGIGFYPDGVGSPSSIALVNRSGHIVANAIMAGTMYADRIRGGTLELSDIVDPDSGQTFTETKVKVSKSQWRYPLMSINDVSHLTANNNDVMWMYDAQTVWPQSKPRWLCFDDCTIIGGDEWDTTGQGDWQLAEDGRMYLSYSWGDKSSDSAWNNPLLTDACGDVLVAKECIGFASPRIAVTLKGTHDYAESNPPGRPIAGDFELAGTNDSHLFLGSLEIGWDIGHNRVTSIKFNKWKTRYVNGFYIKDTEDGSTTININWRSVTLPDGQGSEYIVTGITSN